MLENCRRRCIFINFKFDDIILMNLFLINSAPCLVAQLAGKCCQMLRLSSSNLPRPHPASSREGKTWVKLVSWRLARPTDVNKKTNSRHWYLDDFCLVETVKWMSWNDKSSVNWVFLPRITCLPKKVAKQKQFCLC